MNNFLLLLLAGVVLTLLLLFVLATDGRYFGKPLVDWVYDRLGSSIFSSRSEEARWRQLAKALELTGEERILDVGTAIGDLPISLAALPGFQGTVVGVDRSAPMIATAQQKATLRNLEQHATFMASDIRVGLPFKQNEFDVVVCLGLLETLPHPEDSLTELIRVLKAEGKLVLSLYKGSASLIASLDLGWYEKQLKPSGFEIVCALPLRRSQDIVVASQLSNQ